ncbi:MAG: glutamyl-tRNA reductase [Bacteroidia bacterium]
MNSFKIIAFTYKTLQISEVGKFHLEESLLENRLQYLKKQSKVEELMYLSTCNRVEFLLSTSQTISQKFLQHFFAHFNPSWSTEEINFACTSSLVFEGEEALNHLFNVASSIDSLVVGEREIITQVRNAFEKSKQFGLTGDLIRLAIQKTIETAKRIYTETNIARHPVSVVSLAYRKLKELNVPLNARFLIIGTGITNTNMAKYLKKHGFTNFVLFNRTLKNAENLASELNAKAFGLDELKNYFSGFDVIVTCTGAAEAVITKDIYTSLLHEDKTKKVVIDLAVPNDLDPEILNSYDINLIAVNNLQSIAEHNLKERQSELNFCTKITAESTQEFYQILQTRKVELAMSDVPEKIKQIREMAINKVFAKDLEQLDDNSKELLEKIIFYMEKKYISVPMKMAREIIIENGVKK